MIRTGRCRTFAEAARAGNPDAALAFNPGQVQQNPQRKRTGNWPVEDDDPANSAAAQVPWLPSLSAHQDFTAGEIGVEESFPSPNGRRFSNLNAQYHILSYIGPVRQTPLCRRIFVSVTSDVITCSCCLSPLIWRYLPHHPAYGFASPVPAITCLGRSCTQSSLFLSTIAALAKTSGRAQVWGCFGVNTNATACVPRFQEQAAVLTLCFGGRSRHHMPTMSPAV